ncbi:MAG: CAP domain-containing protein [Myxococcales bacterium]|nr:CAP domain-containing protein [Myxococcales bacterium]
MGCSPDGATLVELLNQYRGENGLAPIPLSPSMCTVAMTHTHDLADNNPVMGNCNLHSWSDQGSWTPCCYTPDHAQAQCMWIKPTELTPYPGNGYENAASGVNTPDAALGLWKGSPPHNDVMLNQGIWDTPWQAVGADVHGGYAVLWFGHESDPQMP